MGTEGVCHRTVTGTQSARPGTCCPGLYVAVWPPPAVPWGRFPRRALNSVRTARCQRGQQYAGKQPDSKGQRSGLVRL